MAALSQTGLLAALSQAGLLAATPQTGLLAVLSKTGLLAATSQTGFKQGVHLPIGQATRGCQSTSATVQILQASTRLTHDAKGIHIPRLGQAAVSEDLWGCIHDGAHMVACRYIFFTLLQGSAQPCTCQQGYPPMTQHKHVSLLLPERQVFKVVAVFATASRPTALE